MGFKYPVFAILTRPATPDMKMINARMPVMLDETDIDAWIRPGKVPYIKTTTDMVAEKM